MIIDTSAWIDFMRDRDRSSAVAQAVEDALRSEVAAVTGPVVTEVLAGARDDAHLRRLDELLARPTFHAVADEHWAMAAELYRACRQRGETVRKMIDCVIAAVAIGADLPILHADRDFDVLARHTPLQVVAV